MAAKQPQQAGIFFQISRISLRDDEDDLCRVAEPFVSAPGEDLDLRSQMCQILHFLKTGGSTKIEHPLQGFRGG